MKIRLYYPDSLRAEERVLSAEHSHYICRVLRAGRGDELYLFNAVHGEWSARVIAAHPKRCQIRIENCTQNGRATPELHVYFAPIKKSRIATIFAMATELGVTHFHPIITRFTHSPIANPERIMRQLIEASEQCGRLDIPTLLPPQKWQYWLQEQQAQEIPFLACVERRESTPMQKFAPRLPNAILVGPEGGFSDQELDDLTALQHCMRVDLGPRILRAETAIAAALAQYHTLSA